MPRPSPDTPALLIWAREAGSSEKRLLAAIALKRGFTPTTLAQRVGRDQGWLGRWFKRNGNGDGETLRLVCAALHVSANEPFRASQRELLDLIETNNDISNSLAFRNKVAEALCASPRRRSILAAYALRRAEQNLEVNRSAILLLEQARSSLEEHDDMRGWRRRRASSHEAPDAFDACKIAISELGVAFPVVTSRNTGSLSSALFCYLKSMRKLPHYRNDIQLFEFDAELQRVAAILRDRGGWPGEALDAALHETRRLWRSFLRGNIT